MKRSAISVVDKDIKAITIPWLTRDLLAVNLILCGDIAQNQGHGIPFVVKV